MREDLDPAAADLANMQAALEKKETVSLLLGVDLADQQDREKREMVILLLGVDLANMQAAPAKREMVSLGVPLVITQDREKRETVSLLGADLVNTKINTKDPESQRSQKHRALPRTNQERSNASTRTMSLARDSCST